MFTSPVWCRCPYDGDVHLHGSWCATTREVGASLPPYDMNGDVAFGQHTSHVASDTALVASAVVAPHVMEEETTQDGGAFVYDEAHEAEADMLAVGRATWYPFEPSAPRLTWLERITRRWPVRVS